MHTGYFHRLPLRPVGTIYPQRFIEQVTTADYSCQQATDNSALVLGVSHQSGNEAPLPGAPDPMPAAIEGEQFTHYRFGEICKIQAGAVFTAGVDLTSDADGKARPANVGERVWARSMQGATAVDQEVDILLLAGHARV